MDDDTLYGRAEFHIHDVFERMDAIKAELEELQAFSVSGLDYFVRSDTFTNEWVREYAVEIGAISSAYDLPWPLLHIDWEAAANDIKSDFSHFDLGDDTYYGR